MLRQREAATRLIDLNARATTAAAELEALQHAPTALAEQGARARHTLDDAEHAHRAAARRLAEAETAAHTADRTARTAEAALSAAREHAVRAESELVQANHAWGTVAERILERLGATPDLPPPPSDIGPDAEEKFRRRHDRLVKEREEMGPVNLRAEIEATALEDQIGTIQRESEEISTAIAKLRGSIGHLNREGRERLGTVFAAVDQHFQQLFARMFGGGRAHLALVGSDDPLTAGLEIYAQPPGKKLTALSLLSRRRTGAHRALPHLRRVPLQPRTRSACSTRSTPRSTTPMSTGSAPCWKTWFSETATRFLVVTHHAHTMARMHRLYGVTMQERGVSRVLSVDLQSAAEMAA